MSQLKVGKQHPNSDEREKVNGCLIGFGLTLALVVVVKNCLSSNLFGHGYSLDGSKK